MSLCDTCPKPGNCCKDFVLIMRSASGSASPRVSRENWEYEGAKVAETYGLPFIPIRTEELNGEERDRTPDKVGVRFGCTKLTPEGRCGDYENRPQLCRSYQAGSDPICVLHESKEPVRAIEKAEA